jgi:membrane protein insertase Oxa1/YidC/SpoIIIJ
MPASSASDAAAHRHDDVTRRRREHVHDYHPSFHHPVIHVMQHWISPLSASLLIFAVHKSGQVHGMTAWLRGASVLLRNKQAKFTQLARPHLFARAALGAGIGGAAYAAAPASIIADPDHVRALRKLYHPDDAIMIDHSLTTWWTTSYVTAALRKLHDSSGLPWWATIAAVTLALRVAVMPINLMLLRNSLRMKIVHPEVVSMGNILRDHHAAREAKIDAAKKLFHTFSTHGCSPWAQMVLFPMLLPATSLSVFGAVYNLCLAEPSMAEEGTLWFPDLVERDDTKLLPILSALTWIWQVEMGAGVHYAALPGVRLGARLCSVAMIPLGATLPSGVFVFWITSNVFAIARGYAARTNWLRSRLNIPLRSEIAALKHLPAFRPM